MVLFEAWSDNVGSESVQRYYGRNRRGSRFTGIVGSSCLKRAREQFTWMIYNSYNIFIIFTCENMYRIPTCA